MSKEILCSEFCYLSFLSDVSPLLIKYICQIVVQAVCDHRSIFTEFDMGWPGSVQDTTVFRESHIWKNKSKYFKDDEYILADKGLSIHLCFLLQL